MSELNTLDEQISEILEEWLDNAYATSSIGVTVDDMRTEDARDREYTLALEKSIAQLKTLFTEHSKQARIDEWQTILKAKISHGGNPAPFNPEGLPIFTSNTEQMTELLHQFAQDRLTQLKRNKGE